MCKNLAILNEVVIPNHPAFRDNPEMQKLARNYPQMFNVELLTELTLAEVGSYDYVDQYGYDFSDYSDSKTVSISEYSSTAEIGSVENKVGALRIVCWNANKPIGQQCDFFYLPHDNLLEHKVDCHGKNGHKERLRFRYSSSYADNYCGFETYRLPSFKDLALA